jgi:hypothetical protein
LAIRYLTLSHSTLNQFGQKVADTALEAAYLPGATLSSVHDALVGCAAEESPLDAVYFLRTDPLSCFRCCRELR